MLAVGLLAVGPPVPVVPATVKAVPEVIPVTNCPALRLFAVTATVIPGTRPEVTGVGMPV